MSKLNDFVNYYLEHLQEAISDVVNFLELEAKSEVLDSFIVAAMILTPIFGTLLFLLILIFGS